MIRLVVRNNTDSRTIMVEGTKTVREAMNESGLPFTSGTMHLNGAPVLDLDRQINSFGTFDEAYLMSVTDGKNA